jgi:hypothetical protein
MHNHGMGSGGFGGISMSAKQKYSAYCYWSAKQGIQALSFNAWKSTVKQGRIF